MYCIANSHQQQEKEKKKEICKEDLLKIIMMMNIGHILLAPTIYNVLHYCVERTDELIYGSGVSLFLYIVYLLLLVV